MKSILFFFWALTLTSFNAFSATSLQEALSSFNQIYPTTSEARPLSENPLLKKILSNRRTETLWDEPIFNQQLVSPLLLALLQAQTSLFSRHFVISQRKSIFSGRVSISGTKLKVCIQKIGRKDAEYSGHKIVSEQLNTPDNDLFLFKVFVATLKAIVQFKQQSKNIESIQITAERVLTPSLYRILRNLGFRPTKLNGRCPLALLRNLRRWGRLSARINGELQEWIESASQGNTALMKIAEQEDVPGIALDDLDWVLDLEVRKK